MRKEKHYHLLLEQGTKVAHRLRYYIARPFWPETHLYFKFAEPGWLGYLLGSR